MKLKLDFEISKNLQKLLDVLNDNKGEPRFVGGMVRDRLAGLEISDVDIATKLGPDAIMDILSKANIKYVDIGSKHGTITAILDFQAIEITTLRIDTECDGRHARVEFTDSFEEDAKRRDFTINAMSYCPYKDELYDYFGGYEDLKNQCVKFIGDPNERIIEDHLRIIRFFRFSDRFARELDESSLRACINHKCLIGSLSKERVKSELDKMMLSNSVHKIFELMIDNQIMEEIIEADDFDLELLSKMPVYVNLKYAALLHKIPDLKILLTKMRFANADIKEIVELSHFRNFYGDLGSTKNLRMIFYPLWVDGKELDEFVEISEVKSNPNFEELHDRMQSPPPKFPVDGNDVMNFGIKGADIATCLEAMKLKWIESDFALSKAELLKGL